MKSNTSDFIRHMKIAMPAQMEYSVYLNTDKDKDKFIKRCERIIRSSTEYRDYISFLKEHVDMDRCAFLNAVSAADSKRVKIEIHHEPFTLYDITAVVVERFMDSDMELNELMIADEVMELHYNNEVGLIPLSKTIHEVVHNSTKLVIPLNMVYGQYTNFLKDPKYEPYVEDLYSKLEKKIDATKNLTKESFDAITKEFTYLDIKDAKEVKKMSVGKETEMDNEVA